MVLAEQFIEEGIERAQQETVRRLLARGERDVDYISDVSGVTPEIVQAIMAMQGK